MTTNENHSNYALWALGLGMIALVMALVHLLAGPFTPQQTAGTGLGQLAAEIFQSAKRETLGQAQPAPLALSWNVDLMLKIAVPVIAVIGLVFGILGYVRHEAPRAVKAGIVLCGSAVVLQVAAFYAAMIIGAVIIVAVIHALSDSLGNIFN